MNLFLALYGQKAEPVYSFARVPRSLDWYKEQSAAWKKVIDANPKNAEAWYYYYRVNRNLLKCDTTDTRPFDDRRQFVTQLIDDMGKQIPESYEYNFIKWAHGGMDMALLPYLQKADQLGANRWEHCEDMINMGIIELNQDKIDRYCKRLYESGNVSSGLLYYNYNVLASTEPNAIIFTVGDNDTYPLYILQSMGFRRDVTVINLHLFNITDYRDKVLKKIGAEPWKKGENSDESNQLYSSEIITHVAANKKGMPVYLGLTVDQPYLSKIEQDLYIIGMCYKYSKSAIDNMAILRRNYEQMFTLDYLSKPFYKDIAADIVDRINCNYVVPMLKLYKHYKLSGDTNSMERVKSILLTISKGKENEKEVLSHLND